MNLADAIAQALRGISIPPGASVTVGVEMTEDGTDARARVIREPHGGVRESMIRDPIGGPPVYVSSQVMPDAMALYMLATSIIDCSRELAEHSRAIEQHDADVKQVIASNEALIEQARRTKLWSIPLLVVCCLLMGISATSLAFSLLHHGG